MRGKNILWISLIATLLMPMLIANFAAAKVGNAKLYIDPVRIPVDPSALGHIGDTFQMAIKVENVEDLWSIAFIINYAPYGRPLITGAPNEGSFMIGEDNYDTSFTYKIDVLNGLLKIGIVRLPRDRDKPWIPLPVVGASGDGTLATFEFTVNAVGDSDIEIINDLLLDSNMNPILHQTRDSRYNGATVNLVRAQVLPGRHVHVGETASFTSKITNNGDVPINATVRFDLTRVEDGKVLTIYAGQRYLKGWKGEPPVDYLYVNEYSEWLEWDWTNPGSSLFGEPDGDYAESIVDAAMSSLYGFEDITLGPNDVIGRVVLEGYTQYPNGATEDVDIDCYSSSFDWYGSLYGTPDWGWHAPRWIGADMNEVIPAVLTEEGLNAVDLLLYNFLGNADNPMRVDSVRLRVEYASVDPVNPPVFLINPGETLELDPVTWMLTEDAIGTYTMSATCEFSYYNSMWTEGAKVRTYTWWVTD